MGDVVILLPEVIARYRQNVLPGKALNTQKTQALQLDKIEVYFAAQVLAELRPCQIADYHDHVARRGRVEANRHLSLIKHVCRYAVRWGYLDHNPAAQISRFPERPSDRYITDQEYTAVRQAAPLWIQILMDLAYVTGQRRQDLLALRVRDLTLDGIVIAQRKTGTRLLVEWSPDLRSTILWAVNALHPPSGADFVICDSWGRPRTDSAFNSAWKRHIARCLDAGILVRRFQFRDIRGKAGSDSEGLQLGHVQLSTLRRHYKRLPIRVRPTL